MCSGPLWHGFVSFMNKIVIGDKLEMSYIAGQQQSDDETNDSPITIRKKNRNNRIESDSESDNEEKCKLQDSFDAMSANSTDHTNCIPVIGENKIYNSTPNYQEILEKSFIDIKICETSVNGELSKQENCSGNKINSFRETDIILESDSDENDSILEENSNYKFMTNSGAISKTKTSNINQLETLLPLDIDIQSKNKPDITKAKLKTDIGDRIRIQQLLAEKNRLEIQISKCKDEVTKCKTTIRTANLSVLPDKGMRLEVALARQESNLRDLLIQEKNLNSQLQKVPNELLLHIRSNQEKPQNQAPQWSKLASAAVNINEMGKKALETHRVQQSLTMDALMRLHNSLKTCPTEETQMSDPKGLSVNLMPHQKQALAWLLWREGEKPSGGILADDMGLGKTLTMLSLILKSNEMKINNEEKKTEEDSAAENENFQSEWLSSSKHKKYRGKTLVICPATLIEQWEREANDKMKSNLLNIEMYHGPGRERKESRLCRRDLVITTYSIVSRDSGSITNKKSDDEEVMRGPLFNIHWERIILDEAHQIRNHKTKCAIAVCELKSKHRWVLTGTPIHNKELDLYSLLKFIRCSPFDDLTVWKRWVDNRDAAGNQRLSTLVKTLMLRRTKADLQSRGALTMLPGKKFNTVEVHLSKGEFDLYQKLLDFSKTLLAQFIEHKAEKEQYFGHMPVATKSSRYKYDMVDNPFEDHPQLSHLHRRIKNMQDVKTTDILVLLLRLRQICCHPCLIKSMVDKEEIKNVGVEDNEGLDLGLLEKMNDMTLLEDDKSEQENDASKMSSLNPKNPIFSPNRQSSKIEAVISTLKKHIFGTEDKAIIVSQWVSMLELIHNVLKQNSVECVSITGSVPVKQRAAIIDDFNQKNRGPKIMLLSLTAGGIGLNLATANHLFLIDLHWNPQLEAQACDRIYRLGQEKDVYIYKFICMDTIEERIQKLQEKKLEVVHNVLTGTDNIQAFKLSLDDLKMLFNMN